MLSRSVGTERVSSITFPCALFIAALMVATTTAPGRRLRSRTEGGVAIADAAVRVDRPTGTYRDYVNRTLIFHGLNFVEKRPPFYPRIGAHELDALEEMGLNVVRLGVMLSGLYPSSLIPNAEYLDQIRAIIASLWSRNIRTIVDLHQDILSPVFCGEGAPSWMINVSQLGSLRFPAPMTFQPSQTADPDPRTGAWAKPMATLCDDQTAFRPLGWFDYYMSDAVNKAFAQVYAGPDGRASGGDGRSHVATTALPRAFEQYWRDVPRALAGTPGLLAYELLNEPHLGDMWAHPRLALEPGLAERVSVGPFMQRMHRIVRSVDATTPILFSPAELNNRLGRSVGYDAAFLPGEPMAFHIYCLTGTDAAGPTTPLTKALCHIVDHHQIDTRTADLRRLRTAGFVTEFGAVDTTTATGRAEVSYVASRLDAARPPLSWTYWPSSGAPDTTASTGTPLPVTAAERRTLARTYPRAVAGDVRGFHFDDTTGRFLLEYTPHLPTPPWSAVQLSSTDRLENETVIAGAAALAVTTEISLSRSLVCAAGCHVTVAPEGCCVVRQAKNTVWVKLVNTSALSLASPSISVTIEPRGN